MTNDEVYRLIKSTGIKQIAKNYFFNIEDEHWVIFLKNGDAVYLDKSFTKSYSITSVFDEKAGELILNSFTLQKIPRKAKKKVKTE
jgi:hypothetical protein